MMIFVRMRMLGLNYCIVSDLSLSLSLSLVFGESVLPICITYSKEEVHAAFDGASASLSCFVFIQLETKLCSTLDCAFVLLFVLREGERG